MAGLIPSEGLLDRVAAYTAEALSAVTMEGLSAPTPCEQWNLLALLLHLNMSLGTLIETFEAVGSRGFGKAGGVRTRGLAPARNRRSAADLLGDDIGTVIAAGVLHRTERLACIHDAVRRHGGPSRAMVGGREPPGDLIVAVGAVEIAVHSWDIASACGRALPIPDAAAAELFAVSTRIVDGAGRPGLFAAAVATPPHASPGDRLVALLGRRPR